MKLTIMDEDLDDDDEVGVAAVSLDALHAGGEVSERWLPILRLADDVMPEKSFGGYIGVRLQTTTVGREDSDPRYLAPDERKRRTDAVTAAMKRSIPSLLADVDVVVDQQSALSPAAFDDFVMNEYGLGGDNTLTVAFHRVIPVNPSSGPYYVKAEVGFDYGTIASSAKTARLTIPSVTGASGGAANAASGHASTLDPPPTVSFAANSKKEFLKLRLKQAPKTNANVELGRVGIPLRWLPRNKETRLFLRLSNDAGALDVTINPGAAGGAAFDVVPEQYLQQLVSLACTPMHSMDGCVRAPVFEKNAQNDETVDFCHQLMGSLGKSRAVYVQVLSCDKLLKMDTFGTCDCFAVLRDVAEAGQHTRLRAIKNSFNPNYDEPPLVCQPSRGRHDFLLEFWDQDMTENERFGAISIPDAVSALYEYPAFSPVLTVPIELSAETMDRSKKAGGPTTAGTAKIRISSFASAPTLAAIIESVGSQEVAALEAQLRAAASAGSGNGTKACDSVKVAKQRLKEVQNVLKSTRGLKGHVDPNAALMSGGPQHDQAAVDYWLARVDALLAKYTPTQRRVLEKVLPELAHRNGGWEHGATHAIDAITKQWGREPSEWPAPPMPPPGHRQTAVPAHLTDDAFAAL